MCTKACDCGKAYRVRFCKCAHGQGHEKCTGPGESSQSCNCNPCPNGPPSDDVVEGIIKSLGYHAMGTRCARGARNSSAIIVEDGQLYTFKGNLVLGYAA